MWDPTMSLLCTVMGLPYKQTATASRKTELNVHTHLTSYRGRSRYTGDAEY